MNLTPVIFTRVCLDDFDIFKIWLEYYRRRYEDIRCCIFRRPGDDVGAIAEFCRQQRVLFAVLARPVFDNRPTFKVLGRLAATAAGQIGLVVDCDEFVSDFDQLDALAAKMPADSVRLKMMDRVAYDVFYNIADCETYEDLCAAAPLTADLTAKLQKWSDEKCCLNHLPDLGCLHYASAGKSSQLRTELHLDHFKWRTSWLEKARRRLTETTSLGYRWKRGLQEILSLLDEGKPRGYLTIPGYFDFDNVYEEQCRRLPDGATLVEVGVWQGRSLAYLAGCAKLLGKRFHLFGVDLFGSQALGRTCWPDVGRTDVLGNLEWRGLGGMVKLLKAVSTDAALCFADRSVDFVWIDATHSMESVMLDVAAWWPKVKAGGAIGGHDLPYFDVATALQKLGVRYEQDRTSWIVRDLPEERPALVVPLP